MTTITDDFMRQRLSQARNYTIVILKKTSRTSEPGADKIIWEHGRRNMAMNADGLLPVVCPVNDGTDLAGVGIFDASVEETL